LAKTITIEEKTFGSQEGTIIVRMTSFTIRQDMLKINKIRPTKEQLRGLVNIINKNYVKNRHNLL